MTAPILVPRKTSAGIAAFYLTEMKAQKTWSGGDIEDGSQDPAATRFRLKLVVGIREVYRGDANTFCFKITARVAIVHNDKTTGTQRALTKTERGEMSRKLGHAAREGVSERDGSVPGWPASLLDNVRQHGGAEEVVTDLRTMLMLSAGRRQMSMAASQSHWGLQNFVAAYLDEGAIGDMVLSVLSRLVEEWLGQEGLGSLKTMPAGRKHVGEGPSNTGLMSSSEAFAAVMIGSELRLQLEGW